MYAGVGKGIGMRKLGEQVEGLVAPFPSVCGGLGLSSGYRGMGLYLP
jgi:hypothetical protein